MIYVVVIEYSGEVFGPFDNQQDGMKWAKNWFGTWAGWECKPVHKPLGT